MAKKSYKKKQATSTRNHKEGIKRREVYVAFAGGGAKAIIHIGALNHIEKHHTIKGVSGTSAGALVAVLKAAGYTSEQMFDPATSGSHVLNEAFNKRPGLKNLVDFIGSNELRKLKEAQSRPFLFILREIGLWSWIWAIVSIASGLLVPHGISSWLDLTGALSFFVSAIPPLLIIPTAIYMIFRKAIYVVDEILHKGIASSEKVIGAIVDLVAAKLRVRGREVLFSDFAMPIKIIAANIDDARAVVFSQKTTPSANLREALTASICIPVAFPPALISNKRYLDGGIVSNLPAYAFMEETYLFPQRKVIALRITELTENLSIKIPSGYKTSLLNIRSTSAAIINTLFVGAQDLAHQTLDVAQVDLPTTLNTLDFDLSISDAQKAHEQGKTYAKKLETQIFRADGIYQDLCVTLASATESLLSGLKSAQVVASRRSGNPVRVAIMKQLPGHSETLKIQYHAGFSESSDDGILIPISGSVCGSAWTSKLITFQPKPDLIRTGLREFKHVQARLDQDMQWVLSVPIIDAATESVSFVINVDSNMKIAEALLRGDQQGDSPAAQAIAKIAALAVYLGESSLKTLSAMGAEREAQ